MGSGGDRVENFVFLRIDLNLRARLALGGRSFAENFFRPGSRWKWHLPVEQKPNFSYPARPGVSFIAGAPGAIPFAFTPAKKSSGTRPDKSAGMGSDSGCAFPLTVFLANGPARID